MAFTGLGTSAFMGPFLHIYILWLHLYEDWHGNIIFKIFSSILKFICWVCFWKKLKCSLHAKSPQSCLHFLTLWTVARQAPLSLGFSRQEYWSGLVCLPPGDLPTSRIKAVSLISPALAGGFFTTSTTWDAHVLGGLLKVLQKPCPQA